MKRLKSARIYFIPSFITLLTLLIFFSASTASFSPEGQNFEFESCTSIIVGKLASIDGSTMTSHSCDSGTDRTWINVVPHRKHKPGEMCKIYFQSKRTKGPDHPDRFQPMPAVSER